MKFSTAALCAVVSGILLALAYPPVGLGFFAYFALVPMMYVLLSSGEKRVFFIAWLSGVVFYTLTLFWIAMHIELIWPVMVVVVVVMAVLYTIPFILAVMAGRLFPSASYWALPFTLTGFEWIHSLDQFAFPWMIIGNSQTCYPFLIQFADITSAFGVSFWVVLVNVVIFAVIRNRRSVKLRTLLALLFVLPAVYSWIVMHRGESDAKEYTVALIQGNVVPDDKWADGLEEWNLNLYRSMSIETMPDSPDLIVWPETAAPVYLAEIPSYRRIVQSMVDSTGVPVLTGMPSIDFATGETWNSAGLFIPGETAVQRYDKLHLVPFGEAFPYDDTFTFLRKIEMGQANWDEGKDVVVFRSPGFPPFNTPICFESIFPDLVRKFIVKGSQIIIVITNDVWFGPYASPIQHAMISVMRAIEFHRPVIRCANTGISMFIDKYGRIESRTGINERTHLIGKVRPSNDVTIYERFGNVFGFLCFVVSLFIFIAYFILQTRIHLHKSTT